MTINLVTAPMNKTLKSDSLWSTRRSDILTSVNATTPTAQRGQSATHLGGDSMPPTSRRGFLKGSAAASAAFVGAHLCSSPWLRAAGANDDVRLAVVGVGSRVKIGGMGRNEIRDFGQIPGVRIVALCDVDEANLGPEVESFAKRNEKVAAYSDVQKLLESKDVDAVVVATPNHWHALVTIWACQAGKPVYVQKPASHNIFEGRKMVDSKPTTIHSIYP
jgi:hypothetical protein